MQREEKRWRRNSKDAKKTSSGRYILTRSYGGGVLRIETLPISLTQLHNFNGRQHTTDNTKREQKLQFISEVYIQTRMTLSTTSKGCARYVQSLLGITHPEEHCRGSCMREHSISQTESVGWSFFSHLRHICRDSQWRTTAGTYLPTRQCVTYYHSGKRRLKA